MRRLAGAQGLVAAGLAAYAVAAWRTHVLLAGGTAVGIVLGLVALAALSLPVRLKPRVALGTAIALALVGTLAHPILAARLVSPPSLMATATVAALPMAFARLGGMVEVRKATLAGAGLGLVGSAAALPFLGPFVAELVAAALLLGAILAMAERDEPAAADPVTLRAAAAALVAGLVGGASMLVLVGGGSHPWPSMPLRAGILLLAASVVFGAGSRLHAGVRVGLAVVLGALAILPAIAPFALRAVDGAVGRLAVSERWPAVGVPGGWITMLGGALLLGVPAGLLAGLAGRALRGSAVLPLALGLGLGLALLVPPGSTREGSRPRRLEGLLVERLDGEPGSRDAAMLVDGHLAAWRTAARERDDRLAAHLGALAAEGRSRALVIGFDPGPSVDALAMHAFATIEVARPLPRLEAGVGALDPPRAAAVAHRASAPAALARTGPFDVIVSEMDDPTLQPAEAFHVRTAHELWRDLLAPRGVLAQRLSLERLGPEGLLRHVLLLRETFPDVHLSTSDFGRGGTVIALCHRAAERPQRMVPSMEPAAPAPLPTPGLGQDDAGPVRLREASQNESEPDERPAEPPWLSLRALTAPDRLTSAVQRDLQRSLVIGADGLLGTFVAGPDELERLRGGLGPHDAFKPGALAFRHPAPPDVARDLARAMLYGELQVADVDLVPDVRTVPGAWPAKWDFGGLESSLPPEWSVERAQVRFGNVVTEAFGGIAIWRDVGRRLRLSAPGRRLDVMIENRIAVDREVMASSIEAFTNHQVLRQGRGSLHGHEVFWTFEQPSPSRQEITVTWHCPFQARLFLAELTVTGGVKPGLYEAHLRDVVDSIRCIHDVPRDEDSRDEEASLASVPRPAAVAPRP